MINYDTKIKQRTIILMTYIHSKQGFPASKHTKWVNIEDAQSTKLIHKDYGNKHNLWSHIEQVQTTAKPDSNGDWHCLCSDKNIGNAIGIGVRLQLTPGDQKHYELYTSSNNKTWQQCH